MKRWWIRLLHHAHPPARSLWAIFILLAAGTLVGALAPWPLKLLVDYVLRPDPAARTTYAWLQYLPGASSNASLIVWLTGGGLLLYCVAQVIRILELYIQTGVGDRLAYNLGGELLDRLQELSLSFHTQRRVGDLVRRVLTDSGCVRDLVHSLIISGIAAVANLVVMIVIMWRLNVTLALVALALALPLAVLIRLFARPMEERSYRQQELEGEMMSLAEQTLGAIPAVQTFTREAEHNRRFRELSRDTLCAYARSMVAQLQFKIGTNAVTAVGTAVVMLIGGIQVVNGTITMGSLLVCLAYVASLYSPLETLAYLSTAYATAHASARRVLEVLDSTERVVESADARPLVVPPSRRGLSVRFDNVTFGYRRSQAVLSDINLEIEPGQIVALVGATGAGKSTLASLLPRLFDPWEGRVCIDGNDLRHLTLSSLRHHVAIVPQEPLLLPVSIAQNIAYARPGATLEEIRRAAASGAVDFVEQLPEGFDTVLGERGCTLSVGQRQRLAIARALLKDAPVLIMDEPTSALDAGTEHTLLAAMDCLMKGRTTLVIAHRLSTIRRADSIVVMDQGQIVEQGTHKQLLSADGIYSRMYRLQTEHSVIAKVGT